MIRDAIEREVEAIDSGEETRSEQGDCTLECYCVISVLLTGTGDFKCINSALFSCSVSEYQLAKPSDSHRKEMLFGSLAKPHHPMAKFCWGNYPHHYDRVTLTLTPTITAGIHYIM